MSSPASILSTAVCCAICFTFMMGSTIGIGQDELNRIATEVSTNLKAMANEELCVSAIENSYSNATYVRNTKNGTAILDELAESVRYSVQHILFDPVERIKRKLEVQLSADNFKNLEKKARQLYDDGRWSPDLCHSFYAEDKPYSAAHLSNGPVARTPCSLHSRGRQAPRHAVWPRIVAEELPRSLLMGIYNDDWAG